MNHKIVISIVVAIGVLFSFSMLTSCQSKEEKVISQMESLCKTVEKESFNIKDLDSLQERFDAVREASKDCNFTNDQLKEVAKLEVRFTKAVAKKALERAGSALEGVINGLSGDNE